MGITLQDIVRKHTKPPLRDDHQKVIAGLDLYTSKREFTKAQVIAATGLNECVANRVLLDMVEYNKLSCRKIDDNGTIGYTATLKAEIQWRKRPWLIADCAYTPEWH